MFKRIKLARARLMSEYLECAGVWYFDIEYQEDWSSTTSHMYFESLRNAEFWARNARFCYILCITDRQGNRILTDYSSYAGAGTINMWTNLMGRSVLDLRKGHNDLWVPKDSKRARGATEHDGV